MNIFCKEEIAKTPAFPACKIEMKIGKQSAITRFVKMTLAVIYSTFPFKKCTTAGAAVAVGVIAVIKAIKANVWLKGKTIKYHKNPKPILTIKIKIMFLLNILCVTLIPKKDINNININKY